MKKHLKLLILRQVEYCLVNTLEHTFKATNTA